MLGDRAYTSPFADRRSAHRGVKDPSMWAKGKYKLVFRIMHMSMY